MKAAIVTGANGFIGSHIVYRLLAQGWCVYALGRSTATTRWRDRVTAALGEVGNLTDSRGKPQSNVQLVELICEAFKVKGMLALEFLESIPRPMSRTEEMILRSLKPYAPYLNSRCEFDLSHARSMVPDYDSYFTQLDVSYIRKIVEFQRRNRK